MTAEAPIVSNFLRNIIDADLAANKFASRRWGGGPGDAASHAAGVADPAKIRDALAATNLTTGPGMIVSYDGVQFDETGQNKNAGIVIVQVERVAERGSLNARQVKIPGILVDCVVLAPPELHRQTFATAYSAADAAYLKAVTALLAEAKKKS